MLVTGTKGDTVLAWHVDGRAAEDERLVILEYGGAAQLKEARYTHR